MTLTRRLQRLEAAMPNAGEEPRYMWPDILKEIDHPGYLATVPQRKDGKGYTLKEWGEAAAALNARINARAEGAAP